MECPGASTIKGTPALKIKACPECGSEIEIFSNEFQTQCKQCGFIAFNDIQSCLSWCKFARDCVGDDVYERFMNKLT